MIPRAIRCNILSLTIWRTRVSSAVAASFRRDLTIGQGLCSIDLCMRVQTRVCMRACACVHASWVPQHVILCCRPDSPPELCRIVDWGNKVNQGPNFMMPPTKWEWDARNNTRPGRKVMLVYDDELSDK